MEYIMAKYFSLYNWGWCTEWSIFIINILEQIKQKTAEALLEARWKEYIEQYLWENNFFNNYWVTQDNSNYCQVLINQHYPTSWKKIKLSEMQFLETYNNLYDNIL